MNATTDLNNVGPIELIYHWTDQIFQGAQGLLAAEKISDFFETVKWNEPFIRALLTMQFAIFAITFITRRNDFIQFGILVLITASTLAAERLNAFGSKYWSRFATQNYFDGPGLFMMVFVSGPFVILANFIVIGMGMRLIKLYAKKARRDARVRQVQAANGTTSEDKKES